MRKSINILSVFLTLLLGLLFEAVQVNADVITSPVNISSTSSENSVLIIAAGVVVLIVVFVSWLVIRSIRKKKNVADK